MYKDILEKQQTTASKATNGLVEICHGLARESGWWDNVDVNAPFVVPAKLCLVHSEISEAMEGARKDLFDDHLPHRKMIEVELADAMIRIMDLAGAMQLDLGGAMVEKLLYNTQRSDHKVDNRAKNNGKKF
tara:strand:+ start:10205 stop:10597 length:393 start_codon:yes stop_codon:yes gene_type:complete